MRHYLVSPSATNDLNQIWDYLAEHRSEESADEFLRSMVSIMGDLAKQPGLGHRRQDLTSLPVHFFQAKPYFIVYSRDVLPLYVHAIVHTSRNVSEVLRYRKLT